MAAQTFRRSKIERLAQHIKIYRDAQAESAAHNPQCHAAMTAFDKCLELIELEFDLKLKDDRGQRE